MEKERNRNDNFIQDSSRLGFTSYNKPLPLLAAKFKRWEEQGLFKVQTFCDLHKTLCNVTKVSARFYGLHKLLNMYCIAFARLKV